MKNEPKILILGDGLLGGEIFQQTRWDVLSRKKDSISAERITEWASRMDSYDTLINCIANTDTYGQERDPHWKVNDEFVYNLISYCNKYNKKLVHISTDYVYSGSKRMASEEDVPVHCRNWYGYTKLLADGLVQLSCLDYLVLRCTHKPRPFPYPEAWVDQFGNFDYVDTIADIVVNMVRKNSSGLYNIGTDLKSIYELAKQTQANPKKIFAPAHVPKNQSMNLDKFLKKCKNQ